MILEAEIKALKTRIERRRRTTHQASNQEIFAGLSCVPKKRKSK
jgi:hypothetical protein